MTTPDTCPECGAELGGLGRCWADGCDYDHRTVGATTPRVDPSPADDQPAPSSAEFTIPWSCMVSVNKRSGGMVGWTKAEYRKKRDAMTLVIDDQYDAGPHTDEVHVHIELYPPDRRSDPHNFQKVIYDALEHAGVIENDRLITRWTGMQCYVDKDNPRAYVRVKGREYGTDGR